MGGSYDFLTLLSTFHLDISRYFTYPFAVNSTFMVKLLSPIFNSYVSTKDE